MGDHPVRSSDAQLVKAAVPFGVPRPVGPAQPFADAGFGEVYISQMSGREPATNVRGCFDFYRDDVLPRLRERLTHGSCPALIEP
jgi:hypothetical protein